MQRGDTLVGRPSHAESAYLLTGFATCAACGGSLATISRMHGTAPHRHLTRFYGCSVHEKRGSTMCANRVVVRQEIVDGAILAAIKDVLDEEQLSAAIEKALARLKAKSLNARDGRAQLERDLHHVDGRISRLLDALADGTAAKDEIVNRLNAEKARKTELLAELERVARLSTGQPFNTARLREGFRARLADVKAALSRHTPHARQLLRKLLADKIAMAPIAHDRRRGYRFRGGLAIDGLLQGEAVELVPSWWPQRDSNPCLSRDHVFANDRRRLRAV